MVEVGKIRVVLADDSAFMRLLLCDMLASEASIEIVGTASNGEEAWQITQAQKPDLVLLDLIMPDFDGVYATRQIMAQCPCPILLLTAQNPENSNSIWEAMQAGAIDFILKPAGMLNSKMREQAGNLVRKIKEITSKERKTASFALPTSLPSRSSPTQIIAIGASTGGTSVIEQLLSLLPTRFVTPIVIAQHIPPAFAQSFAKRLQETLHLPILVAVEGISIEPRRIYLLPADGNMVLQKDIGKEDVFFAYTQETFTAYNAPSIDALFGSVAQIYQNKATGILLTGMGSDGAQGMEQLYKAGSLTIAQDEESCVVFGMPREAIKRGAVHHVLPPLAMKPFLG
jgi:two-component system chemotaxis response regulator CheB